jgi:hypothetical protein
MQAPHRPQKKTAQKAKFGQKKTLKTNWATNAFFGGQSEIFWEPVK